MKILTIILIPLSVFAVVTLNVFWMRQANNEWFLEYWVELTMILAYWGLIGCLKEAIKFLKK